MLYRISVAERGLTGIANIFRSRLSRLDHLLRAGTVPLIECVPSHQGRAAIHRPECSLRSVECVLMHNITIFAFLHFVLIYLFMWHKVFCVRVTLCHSVVEKMK